MRCSVDPTVAFFISEIDFLISGTFTLICGILVEIAFHNDFKCEFCFPFAAADGSSNSVFVSAIGLERAKLFELARAGFFELKPAELSEDRSAADGDAEEPGNCDVLVDVADAGSSAAVFVSAFEPEPAELSKDESAADGYAEETGNCVESVDLVDKSESRLALLSPLSSAGTNFPNPSGTLVLIRGI